jgi:hypothetical protein
LRIEFIAYESMGVRAMSTFVETKDMLIYIDPGVSLAPRRYGLPPHEIEIRRLEELAQKIYEKARDSEFIIITHYHYDHHDRGLRIPLDIYDRKILCIKDPLNNINYSQKIRSSVFLKLVKDRVRSIEICDNRIMRIGSLEMIFSEAQPHGHDPRLGYVIQIFINDKENTFLYTSDIEGAPLEQHIDFIKRSSPDIIVMDGPLTYLLGIRLPEEMLRRSVQNTIEIVEKVNPEILVLEHHILRDKDYKERFKEVFNKAEEMNTKILTAAEFMGQENMFLEAYRYKLFGKEFKEGSYEEHDEATE